MIWNWSASVICMIWLTAISKQLKRIIGSNLIGQFDAVDMNKSNQPNDTNGQQPLCSHGLTVHENLQGVICKRQAKTQTNNVPNVRSTIFIGFFCILHCRNILRKENIPSVSRLSSSRNCQFGVNMLTFENFFENPKMFLWTPRMQLWQPCRKFRSKSENFPLNVRNLYFSSKNVFPNCICEHAEMSQENTNFCLKLHFLC